MNGVPKRSPGINILLFIVTLGVFWFYWIYKAFMEIAQREGKPLSAKKFVPILIAVWVPSIGLAVFRTVQNFGKEPAAGQNIVQMQLEALGDPLFYVAAALALAFYGLQLVYLRQAHGVVLDAAVQAADPNPPSITLMIVFNILFMIGVVPFVGGIASLGAAVVAIIWVVQVQSAMNRYWDRVVQREAPSLAPPGWMPPSTPAAATAATAPDAPAPAPAAKREPLKSAAKPSASKAAPAKPKAATPGKKKK